LMSFNKLAVSSTRLGTGRVVDAEGATASIPKLGLAVIVTPCSHQQAGHVHVNMM
jgi:hypothetical protein